MTEKYLIGVDLGSSFTKASLFDTRGRALGEARRDTHPDQPRPEVHRFYQQYAGFYGRLLDQAGPAYHELASLPEWPGSDRQARGELTG